MNNRFRWFTSTFRTEGMTSCLVTGHLLWLRGLYDSMTGFTLQTNTSILLKTQQKLCQHIKLWKLKIKIYLLDCKNMWSEFFLKLQKILENRIPFSISKYRYLMTTSEKKVMLTSEFIDCVVKMTFKITILTYLIFHYQHLEPTMAKLSLLHINIYWALL